MGAGASKGSGVAATTVRRALPKAGDAAAVAATTSGRASTRTQEMLRHDAERQLQERREASQSTSSSSPRSEHSFFRPMARNDGTLAPVKPAEVDIQKMVGEKDQTLVKRMDQLAGGISMSRLEISGHVRAREIAQKRRTAQEGRLRIKTANARDILREAAGDPKAHGTDEATVVELMRWYEDADTEDLPNESEGAPPGSMLKVKRTREERAADDERAKRGAS